jgi:hypothetical protein
MYSSKLKKILAQIGCQLQVIENKELIFRPLASTTGPG